jgi:hypothetical protein
MGLFDRLLKKKAPSKSEECVLIYLDCVNLPAQVYEEYDLATLEEQLATIINRNGAGEWDGNELGEDTARIFTYGPDADRLYRVMEPVLKSHPLCQNARIVIRKGGPGAPQTQVQL